MKSWETGPKNRTAVNGRNPMPDVAEPNHRAIYPEEMLRRSSAPSGQEISRGVEPKARALGYLIWPRWGSRGLAASSLSRCLSKGRGDDPGNDWGLVPQWRDVPPTDVSPSEGFASGGTSHKCRTSSQIAFDHHRRLTTSPVRQVVERRCYLAGTDSAASADEVRLASGRFQT